MGHETNAERIADTVVWYPQGYYMPKATSLDTAAAAAYDLVQALLRPRPPTLSPLCPESMHNSLLRLATILKDSILHEKQSTTNSTPVTTNLDSILSPLPTSPLPLALLPRVDSPTTIPQSSALPRVVPTPATTIPPPLLPTIAPPTYSHVTRNPGQRRRQAAKAKKSSLARSALGRSSFPNKNTTFPILHLLMILPMMKLFLLLIQ